MKKFYKAVIIIILIVAIGIGGWFGYQTYLESTYIFYVDKVDTVQNSTFHHNGTWWGYHQSKIVSIGETVFTYYTDNSTQQGQVANLNNPNKAVFLMQTENGIEEFGRGNASRPCNVLADQTRNLIYYVIVEPTSTNDAGTMGKIVMYTYLFHPEEKTVEFVSKEDITESGDNGQIRTAAVIDVDGNIAVAYGGYDSYMYVYIRDAETKAWQDYRYLSNTNEDELLYPFIILESKTKFHLLAVQDTNVYGTNYYHFVMVFTYDNGNWSSQIVVDYRNDPLAESQTNIVEQNEFYKDGDDIHIIIRAQLKENIYHHYIYKNGTLSALDNIDASNKKWVKLIKYDGKLYYLTLAKHGNISIIDYETEKTVFSKSIDSNRSGDYIYIDRNVNDKIRAMLCTGDSENFEIDNIIVTIKLKE